MGMWIEGCVSLIMYCLICQSADEPIHLPVDCLQPIQPFGIPVQIIKIYVIGIHSLRKL